MCPARIGALRDLPPPAAPDPEELAPMRWIDEQYLATPFYGSRRMTAELRQTGRRVNRKRVQRLMRLMGLEALGPKPRTSRPAVPHRLYPYLLHAMTINRPNQVWAAMSLTSRWLEVFFTWVW
jgi:putative transposase